MMIKTKKGFERRKTLILVQYKVWSLKIPPGYSEQTNPAGTKITEGITVINCFQPAPPLGSIGRGVRIPEN